MPAFLAVCALLSFTVVHGLHPELTSGEPQRPLLTMWSDRCSSGDRIYIPLEQLPGLSGIQYSRTDDGSCSMIATQCYQIPNDAVSGGRWYVTLLSISCPTDGMASYSFDSPAECEAHFTQASSAITSAQFQGIVTGMPGNIVATQNFLLGQCHSANDLEVGTWISPRGANRTQGRPFSCSSSFSSGSATYRGTALSVADLPPDVGMRRTCSSGELGNGTIDPRSTHEHDSLPAEAVVNCLAGGLAVVVLCLGCAMTVRRNRSGGSMLNLVQVTQT